MTSSERLKARWKDKAFRAKMMKAQRERITRLHKTPRYRAIMEQVWEKLHQAWHDPQLRPALIEEALKGSRKAAANRLKRKGVDEPGCQVPPSLLQK